MNIYVACLQVTLLQCAATVHALKSAHFLKNVRCPATYLQRIVQHFLYIVSFSKPEEVQDMCKTHEGKSIGNFALS